MRRPCTHLLLLLRRGDHEKKEAIISVRWVYKMLLMA